MLNRSILLCMGTRPEVVKMAPVYHELESRGINPVILHTGQHLEMAQQMYSFFGLKPALSLDLGDHRETLAQLSSLLLERIGRTLADRLPAAVLVHGDTSSALMAALAAFYLKLPVGHVEAGLRSHHGYDPFPEEKHREMIARLASWHFAPTPQAVQNLRREGIPAEAISLVGNTVVDAVNLATEISQRDAARGEGTLPPPLTSLNEALSSGKRLLLVTSHRRENLEGPLGQIARAMREVLEEQSDAVLVWPVHANPKIRTVVEQEFRELNSDVRDRVFLCEPLDYPTLIWIMRHAWLILTDSGGIQEEAASLHVPILVLRDTTERPELITSGGGAMVGTNRQHIVAQVRNMAADLSIAEKMRSAINPFGDGFAAKRIADVLICDLDEKIAA